MPCRASSLAVTRVSSQAMASAPRNTASAGRVMSPALRIGVATTCKPGAGRLLPAEGWLGSPPSLSTSTEVALVPPGFPASRLPARCCRGMADPLRACACRLPGEDHNGIARAAASDPPADPAGPGERAGDADTAAPAPRPHGAG